MVYLYNGKAGSTLLSITLLRLSLCFTKTDEVFRRVPTAFDLGFVSDMFCCAECHKATQFFRPSKFPLAVSRIAA
jgi:hypothetical protein